MMAVAAKLPAQSIPVSQRHDADEREARRVAEVVERGSGGAGWSFSSVPVSAQSAQASDHTRTCGCGGTCPQCRAAKLRPSARADTAAASVDSGVVAPALRTSGRPLEPAARSFFEARLGADFSAVRIHADSEAARSADSLNAHAYAVGRHVVFGAGEYRPDSAQGRRLLAHELAHVVQQGSGEERIQRDDKEAKATPVDVAIVLDSDIKSLRAAQGLAAKAIRVYNASDAADKLKKIGAPIGTLYVVSHANSAGELQFESKDGIVIRVKLADLAKDLKGVLPADKTPQVIDFRGCKLGDATDELGKFRTAVGAKTVKAVNCWTFDDVEGPVSIDGLPITSEGDLNDDNRARFEKGLGMLVNKLGSKESRLVDCILGLGPGETAAKNMAKIRKQYFRAGGTITAEWVSPEYDEKWQAGSKCFKDLTTSTKPCKLTEKTAPPPEPAQGSGKKAAAEGLETPAEGVEATASAPAPEAEEATA